MKEDAWWLVTTFTVNFPGLQVEFGQKKKNSFCLPLPIVPTTWSWWICRILVEFFFVSVLLKINKSASVWHPLSTGLMYRKAASWMKVLLTLSWLPEALGASVQHTSKPFESHLFPQQLVSCILQNSPFSIFCSLYFEQNQNNICLYLVYFLWCSPGSVHQLSITCLTSTKGENIWMTGWSCKKSSIWKAGPWLRKGNGYSHWHCSLWLSSLQNSYRNTACSCLFMKAVEYQLLVF